MKQYIKLVKTFLLSGEMPKAAQKNKVKFYIILGIISTIFIFIPCFLLMGFLVYMTTDGIKQEILANITYQPNLGNGLALVIQFICAFSMIFGFNIILNTFYFSGDIEHILPLPIKPKTLISSKFTAVVISESIMEFLFLIAAFLGFSLATGFNLLTIIMGLIGTITLPILPLVYCGIIALLIMRFTKIIKNKNNGLTLALLGIIIIVGMIAINYLDNDSITNFISLLAAGKIKFIELMNVIFPSTYFLVKALVYNDILAFACYLATTAIAYLIFMVLAEKLYLPGVKKISNNADTKTETVDSILPTVKKKNYLFSYFTKELKILFRTPSFFGNCILSNLLWPIIIILIYLIQGTDNIITEFINEYQTGKVLASAVILISVFVVSTILTTTNSIAASSITREGKHFAFMKYIPMSYKEQLNVKAMVSIVISFLFNFIYLIIIAYFLKATAIDMLLFIVIALGTTIFFTYLGIYLDTINPKLIWEDELNALRGNENTFFSMAISLLIAITAGIIIYYFNQVLLVPVYVLELMLIIVLAMGSILMYYKTMDKGIKNVKEIEI